MNVLFNGGKHVLWVIGQLFEEFFIVTGILKLAVIGLSRYHEEILKVLLFNMQRLIKFTYFFHSLFRQILFLMRQ